MGLYEEVRKRKQERALAHQKAQEEQKALALASAEKERQATAQAHEYMKKAIKQGQERQREQGLDYWISDITDAETRKELKLLLIETKRAFLS